MARFGYIRSFGDVGEHDLTLSATDREHFKGLMMRLGEISSPGSGASKVLQVCARVVKDEAAWTEGTLRVNFVGEGPFNTRIEFLSDSAGLVERLFPAIKFHVPLSEFTSVAEKTPHLIAPLRVLTSTPKKLAILGSVEEARASSRTPRISDESIRSIPPAGSIPPPASMQLLGNRQQRTEEAVSDGPRSDRATIPGSPPSGLLRAILPGGAAPGTVPPPTRRAAPTEMAALTESDRQDITPRPTGTDEPTVKKAEEADFLLSLDDLE